MTHPLHAQFSREVAPLERSVMRDLLALAVDPKVISFAGGLPASDGIPVERYSQCLKRVLARDGARAMQYSPAWQPLQQWLANWMLARGIQCTPEQIFITNGAQQGLAILSRLFLDTGQPAVIEAISFTGIQQVTKGRGAQVRAVPIDPERGVDPIEWEAAMAEKPRPQLAIMVPAFHNPLSATMPATARQEVAELAARYQVPLVEDDPYSPLRFAGSPVPPIKAYDEAGFVFYLGSFSKLLAPAVRLGWIVAPPELISKITVLRESFDLESSTLTQRAVAEFLESGGMEEHLNTIRELHRQRRDAMLAALEKHLANRASWTRPEGGLFIWLTLAEGMDCWKLFERAVAHNVAFIPGGAFAVDGGSKNTLRLSFSNVRPENIDPGVSRLARAIAEAGD